MTERQQRNTASAAMFTVAVAVVGLAVTIAYGIAQVSFSAGNFHNEHQQIFTQQAQILNQQQQMLKEIRESAEKRCK